VATLGSAALNNFLSVCCTHPFEKSVARLSFAPIRLIGPLHTELLGRVKRVSYVSSPYLSRMRRNFSAFSASEDGWHVYNRACSLFCRELRYVFDSNPCTRSRNHRTYNGLSGYPQVWKTLCVTLLRWPPCLIRSAVGLFRPQQELSSYFFIQTTSSFPKWPVPTLMRNVGRFRYAMPLTIFVLTA
jgi:hypothetical protein